MKEFFSVIGASLSETLPLVMLIVNETAVRDGSGPPYAILGLKVVGGPFIYFLHIFLAFLKFSVIYGGEGIAVDYTFRSVREQ